MHIRVGYEIVYECPQPTPMILALHVHPSRVQDLVVPDQLYTAPPLPITSYADTFGNVCSRIVAPAGETRLFCEGVVNDSGEPDPVVPSARQHAVEDLPSETLQFLLPSRYCETDLMLDFAWKTFGNAPLGWGRVQAICDFAHHHVAFGYEHARPTRTAREAHAERVGVCRDYTHLAVTLCRCMNIPARYCTGYLGDIGVPPPYGPMDFAAWFEAFLDGRWHVFDPRNHIPRIGRVLVARGRDAADVALTTTFGPNVLKSFKVVTDEVVTA